jgi:hypothetical protein
MRYALLLLAGVSAGCANNDLSLSIVQMEALTAPACVADATIAVGLSRGVYDVALGAMFARGYIGVPLVRNNLTSRNPGGLLEYNSIQTTGVNVDIQLPDSVAGSVPAADQRFLSYYYPATSGRLDPAGLGPTFVELITFQLAHDLQTQGAIPDKGLLTVIAKLRPVGMLQSDQVVGGPYWFPIDICNGCLTATNATCPLPMGTTVPQSCFPAQDTVQACCNNPSGPPTCGTAAVATM